VKRVTRPMLGFKSFESAQPTLTGIELMHMLRKGQLAGDEFEALTLTRIDPLVLIKTDPSISPSDGAHHRS
jgi:hypothetical protein